MFTTSRRAFLQVSSMAVAATACLEDVVAADFNAFAKKLGA
jgi:hypothetical protein